jgi:hypothetical protein
MQSIRDQEIRGFDPHAPTMPQLVHHPRASNQSFDTAETHQRRDWYLNSLAALFSQPFDTV